MFEKASRLKLRFDSVKGQLSVEDLWDLPLTSAVGKANLDAIAVDLYSRLSNAPQISFVNPTANVADATIQLKLEIVKHVIAVRVAENAARAQATERAATRQRIMEAIEAKKDDAIKGASLEDLQKMLDSLA